MAIVVDSDPGDPYDFGPRGSGSVIILYGSGSLHQQAKKYQKPRYLLFCDFFMTIYLRVSDPVSDPDWIRIKSGQESGSGSRRAKMAHKSRKKFVKVHVLKCWMASFES